MQAHVAMQAHLYCASACAAASSWKAVGFMVMRAARSWRMRLRKSLTRPKEPLRRGQGGSICRFRLFAAQPRFIQGCGYAEAQKVRLCSFSHHSHIRARPWQSSSSAEPGSVI